MTHTERKALEISVKDLEQAFLEIKEQGYSRTRQSLLVAYDVAINAVYTALTKDTPVTLQRAHKVLASIPSTF